jgi:hypothetical protein
MPVSSNVRAVFGHFQNLNLLALLHDLYEGHTAQRAWRSGGRLCPVAHGLPAGRHVKELSVMGQAADLADGCDYAARHLGAEPDAVLRFVRGWDEETFGRGWLIRQLEELWEERLEDAEFTQQFLQGGQGDDETARPAWGAEAGLIRECEDGPSP